MIELSKCKLSDELLLKLKDKNITTLSEMESSVFNIIINGTNVVLESSVNSLCYIIPFVKKLEGIKKLKSNRKTRLIIIVDNDELCNQLSKEIKSLITKELVILTSHSGTGLKKIKKKLQNPSDVIILTLDRLSDLVNLDVLKLKCAKHIVIVNYDKINSVQLDNILTSAFIPEVDVSSEDLSKMRNIQLIVTTSVFNQSLKVLMDKYTNETYENKISKVDSTEIEVSSDDSISSDEEVVKINGNQLDINKESNEEEEALFVSTSSQEQIKTSEYDIDEKLLSKLRGVSNFNKYKSMSKLLIEEFGDVDSVSRLISVMTAELTPGSKKADKQIKKSTVTSGSGSKLTGRDGYTGYHFVTDKEVTAKGYLFKSLKRLIEEDLVEKIERVQLTKDLRGFVFDLPSEYDEAFQYNWRDGKFDSMSLITKDVPELDDSPDRNTGGGNRGRGGDRGSGFRGRGRGDRGRLGNDRGGGRLGNDRGGGRGNDRGGHRGGPFKRPGGPVEGTSSKVVKFD